MVTVVLNGYKRPAVLNEQVEALRAQSIPPSEILVWYNDPGEGFEKNLRIGDDFPTAYSTKNFGVWARFFYALNAAHPFVCVFDDDTVPGSRWIENCLFTIKTHEGLLGTIGLIFPEGSRSYSNYKRVGWNGPNESTTEVDFVGHSWFFKKEWLSYFVRDLPDLSYYNICGEDMHFSYMLQKYAGIKTFVPPHPENDKSLWGSLKAELPGYGASGVSIWESNQNNSRSKMSEFFKKQVDDGWVLVNEKR
jgi:hypothetical protein